MRWSHSRPKTLGLELKLWIKCDMSIYICVHQSSLCNQSGAKSELVHCLYMKITACLPALLNLSRENVCELVSTFSAYESCLVYLKKTCGSYVNVSCSWHTLKSTLFLTAGELSRYTWLIHSLIAWFKTRTTGKLVMLGSHGLETLD